MNVGILSAKKPWPWKTSKTITAVEVILSNVRIYISDYAVEAYVDIGLQRHTSVGLNFRGMSQRGPANISRKTLDGLCEYHYGIKADLRN